MTCSGTSHLSNGFGRVKEAEDELGKLWMLGHKLRHQPVGHGPPMLVQIFTSMPLRHISYHLGPRGQLLPSPRPQKLDTCFVISLLLGLPWAKQVTKLRMVSSLVIQGLRLCTDNAGGLGSIPGQGTRSHMPQLWVCMLQLKILHAAMKIKYGCCNSDLMQPNK